MRYRVGSFCHCGSPEECDDHWQVETDEEPKGGPIQVIVADDLTRENADRIAYALNAIEGT